MPACHAGGRRFEPVPDRQFFQYGGYRQVVKTMGCGSIMRGFESHYPPQLIKYRGNMAQLVEQLTVNQWVTGSSPVIPANMLVWLNGRAADL